MRHDSIPCVYLCGIFLLLTAGEAVATTTFSPGKQKINSFTPYHKISLQLFPGAWKTSRPFHSLFRPTTGIQAGYYSRLGRGGERAKTKGMTKFRDILVVENDEYVNFIVKWKIKNVKRIVLYNLDASRAKYKCCTVSSTEYVNCTLLATLISYYDLPRHSRVDQVFPRARHAIISFRERAKSYGRMLVEAETWDGQYFRYHFWLYHNAGYHGQCRY